MRATDSDPLRHLLSEVYGDEVAREYTPKLRSLIRKIEPPSNNRVEGPGVILIAYPDHLRQTGEKPLQTLAGFCRRHLSDTVHTVHVLPFYPYTSDDGFAVSDYLSVNPEFGDWQDLHEFSHSFRLMYDGVFNHVSASHKWFQGFLAGEEKYQNYFIAMDDKADVSAVTRPRTSPLLINFDTARGPKYVWATFSEDQLDLNYADPDVLLEIIATLLEYVRHGAGLVRLDAIAYLWKQLGTNSIHLSRTHTIIRLFREVLAECAPWVRLVTETNVPHHENITYFGNGHDEAHMVYNFALPALVAHTIQTGDAAVLSSWAATLSAPSENTAFFNFTASHDGIGLLGVKRFLSQRQIDDMCDRVTARGGHLSMRTLPSGQQSVYEMNISYFNAVADPAAPLATQIDQFICSQAIALCLAGVPGIYFHSLLGSTNWDEGMEKLGYNRAINREKLDLEAVEKELSDPQSRRHQVFDRYTRLLKLRTGEPAFNASAAQTVQQAYGPSILAVKRTSKDKTSSVFAIHNVTSESQTVKLSRIFHDLITDKEFTGTIQLSPYQVAWLKPV